MQKIFLVILSFIILPIISRGDIVFANVFEDLCKDGYYVFNKTSISGTFEGCDYEKVYKLDNGLKFECQEYNYSYSYYPDVYLLTNKYNNIKVIIEDEKYAGRLYW